MAVSDTVVIYALGFLFIFLVIRRINKFLEGIAYIALGGGILYFNTSDQANLVGIIMLLYGIAYTVYIIIDRFK